MNRRFHRGVIGAFLFLTALFALWPAPGSRVVTAADPVVLKKTEKIPGTDVTFEMVLISGGEFLMGSPPGEKDRNPDEGPQHLVRIAPFWMETHEVTWDEYNIYRKEMGVENPDQNDMRLKSKPDAITGPTPPYVDETYGHGRQGFPAICMTHHAAMEYCRWLSDKTGKAYRLPTEAEWEYACRAGSRTAYFFGNDPKNLGDYAWIESNSEEHTHKVATKKPNAWGLYDMAGNVSEWCLDHYNKDYYSTFPVDKPTQGPVLLPTDKRFSHVTRGGSWTDAPAACRSAARRGSDKTWLKKDPQRPQSIWWLTEMDMVGFRIVRAVEEQENLKGIRSRVIRKSPNY